MRFGKAKALLASLFLVALFVPAVALADEGAQDTSGSALVAGAIDLDALATAATENDGIDAGLATQASGQYWDPSTMWQYYYEVLDENKKTAALSTVQWIKYYDSVTFDRDPSGKYGSLDLVIPSKIDGYTITQLGVEPYGFDLSPCAKSVTIPDSVTTLVGTFHYSNCKAINWPKNCKITAIPDRWMDQDNNVPVFPWTTFTLPDSITSIGDYAFFNCKKLQNFRFPKNLKSIGDMAFHSTSLKSLDLTRASKLKTIGTMAFAWASLDSYDLATDSYTTSDAMNQSGTIKATKIVLPDSVETIGDYAFTGAYVSVNRDYWAYTGPTRYTSIKLGSGVKKIGAYAFAGSRITSLSLPKGLQEIGADAFVNSCQLKSVTWTGTSVSCAKIGEEAFSACPKLAAFTAPKGVKSIGGWAFSYCEALKTVKLAETVTTIGECAFGGCSILTSINIPSGVTALEDGVFGSCVSLASIKLPAGLQTIGANAFSNCSSLKSITIPSKVKYIGECAFGGLNLSDSSLGSPELYGAALTSVTFEQGDGKTALEIGPFAFAGCTNLSGKTIDMPARVRTIDGGAFFFIENATYIIRSPKVAIGTNGGSSLRTAAVNTYTNMSKADAKAFGGHKTYTAADIAEYNEWVKEGIDDLTAADVKEYDTYWTADVSDPWASKFAFYLWNLPSVNGGTVYYPSTLTRSTSPTFTAYVNCWEKNNKKDPFWPDFKTFATESDLPSSAQPSQGSSSGGSSSGSGSSASAQPSQGSTGKAVAATRLYGQTALDTMSAIVQKGFAKGSCDTVIVASVDGYWDALAASSLAGKCGCPVLMTNPSSLSSQTLSEIKRLGAKKAYVAGGTAAVSSNVEKQLKAQGLSVERLWGADAQVTAIKIAQALGSDHSDTCIIATSTGHWDALSASPYAYAAKAPVFLTDGSGELRSDTLKAIEAGGYKRAVIAGGTAVVKSSVEKALKGAGVSSVSRCGGSNAYNTAILLAKWEVKQGMGVSHIGIATCANGYWDALSGAARCGSTNSVLVLADGSNTDAVSQLIVPNAKDIEEVDVFGGPAAVDKSVDAAVAKALSVNK